MFDKREREKKNGYQLYDLVFELYSVDFFFRILFHFEIELNQ